MKAVKKRAGAVLVLLLLLCGVFPTTALAAENPSVPGHIHARTAAGEEDDSFPGETDPIETEWTPLAQPGIPTAANWGLVDLLVAGLCTALSVFMLAGVLRGNRQALIWRVLAALAGIAAPVVFFIVEDLSRPMAVVSSLTAWMSVILLLQLTAVLVCRLARIRHEGQSENEA